MFLNENVRTVMDVGLSPKFQHCSVIREDVSLQTPPEGIFFVAVKATVFRFGCIRAVAVSRMRLQFVDIVEVVEALGTSQIVSSPRMLR